MKNDLNDLYSDWWGVAFAILFVIAFIIGGLR